jgi:hypothetical protein
MLPWPSVRGESCSGTRPSWLVPSVLVRESPRLGCRSCRKQMDGPDAAAVTLADIVKVHRPAAHGAAARAESPLDGTEEPITADDEVRAHEATRRSSRLPMTIALGTCASLRSGRCARLNLRDAHHQTKGPCLFVDSVTSCRGLPGSDVRVPIPKALGRAKGGARAPMDPATCSKTAQ